MVAEPLRDAPAVGLIAVGNDAVDVEDAIFAVVDAADYDRLAGYRWFYSRGYAVRVEQLPDGAGYRLTSMHRDVMNAAPGTLIDHINRNRLDNRRSNLRIASRRLNVLNSSLSHRNTSGCTGVDWHKSSGLWRARLRFGPQGRDGEKLLGYFEDKEDAIAARLIAVNDLLATLT